MDERSEIQFRPFRLILYFYSSEFVFSDAENLKTMLCMRKVKAAGRGKVRSSLEAGVSLSNLMMVNTPA